MGINRILVYVLLFLMFIGILVTLPTVRNQVSQFFRQTVLNDQSDTRPRLTERESDKKACGLCHTELSQDDFNRKNQHAPFVKWYCTDCHTPHSAGNGKSQFIVDVNKLCSTCHFNRMEESIYKYQHKPYQLGYCTDCHDPHSSDNSHLLRVSPANLCTTCHKMDLVYNFPNKHKPYEIGACADCHSPHASKNRGLTKLPGKELCYSCHYDRLNENEMPVQHKPFQTGECVNCHGPHAAPGDKLLLLSGNSLCLACHQGMAERLQNGNIHAPVKDKCTNCHVPHASEKPALLPETRSNLCFQCHSDLKKDFEKMSRHPVGNGSLECDGCHDPHVGKGDKLLKKQGNQLCYTCHLGLEDTYEKLKHATKAEGRGGLGACTNCHLPHGSDYKPLLLDKQEPMCDNCHTYVGRAMINHPYGEKYDDPWRGGVMHCTSCHGPHGTANEKFTLLPDDALCLKCHGKKAKDNPDKYNVNRKISPLNEPKEKSIDSRVPDYDKAPISKTVNRPAKVYKK